MTIPDLNLNSIDEFRGFKLNSLLYNDYTIKIGGSLKTIKKNETFMEINVVNGVPINDDLDENIVKINKEKLDKKNSYNPLQNINLEYNEHTYSIEFMKSPKKPVLIKNIYTSNNCYVPSNIRIVVHDSLIVNILEIVGKNTGCNQLVINNREFEISNSIINYSKYESNTSNTDQIYNYFGSVNGGKLNCVNIDSSGEICMNNWDISLRRHGSECSVLGVVRLKNSMRHGTICKINHISDGTKSNQEFRNILDDNSFAMYDGDSYIQNDGFDSISSQQSKTILLSSNARVLTKPRLNIFTGEVKSTHGATVGKLNQDNMFYMKQRGIPEEVVKKILIDSYVKDIIDSISSKEIREYIYDKRWLPIF